MKITRSLSVLLIFGVPMSSVHAQDLANEITDLRQLLGEFQADYDARISDLEERLARAERQAKNAQRDADEAIEIAEQTAIDQSSGSAAQNVFNPAIGSVVVARYATVDQTWQEIPGFMPGGEIGPGGSGFSIGETDFNLASNIDPKFFGNLTLAIGNYGGETEVSL